MELTSDPEPFRPLRIVLPGGSGQIGNLLARHLQSLGHHVTVLTRSPYSAPWQTVHWDGVKPGPWSEELEGADACINLSGRSINCRFTLENRQAIYESRIGSTQLIGQVIAGLRHPPRVWINASAASLYRLTRDANGLVQTQSEDSPLEGEVPEVLQASELRWRERRGFFARVARDWEAAFYQSNTPQTRKISLRTTLVCSPLPGTAFGVLSNLVRLGLGGTQGNGRQFVSWIHERDFARAVSFLIENESIDGPVNLASPTPRTNREFMALLRWAWNVPNGLPAPAIALLLGALFLRTEPELILTSSRIVPMRLLEAGFNFDFPDWPEAAEDLVEQWKKGL